MCNSPTCSHDLDDSLDGLFDGPVSTQDLAAGVALARAQQVRMTHDEKCPSCSGTGRFRSYTGRIVGDCFKCKGKGVLTFRTSVADREKSREAAAKRRDRQSQDLAEQAAGWRIANPVEAAWLDGAADRGFEFAVSLREALAKYGHLTERQHAACTNAAAKSAAKRAEWQAAQSVKAEVNVDKLAEAFATAKDNMLKFPKIRLGGFIFSLAGASSANAGAIYVKAEDGTYLGKVMQGRFSRSRDCSADLEPAIAAAAADPEGAAAAYGLQTGRCSCCGRELTAKDSVGLGIGPVCREKWGW